MSSISLYSQLEKLPAHLRKEVENFIEFLLEKDRKEKKSKENSNSKSLRGVFKDKIKISKDFDSPLEDFKEYM
jgi:hypothetical protein